MSKYYKKEDIDTQKLIFDQFIRVFKFVQDEENSIEKLIDDFAKVEQEDTIHIQSIGNYLNMQDEENSIEKLLDDFAKVEQEDTIHIQSIENYLNIQRLKKYRKKYNAEFLYLIEEQNCEYGIDSLADVFIRKRMQENETITKEWLNEIFIENYDSPIILIGILRVISHLEYNDIKPQGITMAISALSHINVEVRECGIRAFESWGTIDSLKILQELNYSEEWLRKYINQIVIDLKEEWNLNGPVS